jgi:hypothetical protein
MTLLILAGVAVLWMAMQSRRRIREMEHRERLAMIERGLIPPPELDPGLFEQRAGILRPETPASARSRSLGVIMIGIGLGLMLLISSAGEAPNIGVGVGGACALLGAAFLVNAKLSARQDVHQAPPAPNRASSIDRREPPSNSVP